MQASKDPGPVPDDIKALPIKGSKNLASVGPHLYDQMFHEGQVKILKLTNYSVRYIEFDMWRPGALPL